MPARLKRNVSVLNPFSLVHHSHQTEKPCWGSGANPTIHSANRLVQHITAAASHRGTSQQCLDTAGVCAVALHLGQSHPQCLSGTGSIPLVTQSDQKFLDVIPSGSCPESPPPPNRPASSSLSTPRLLSEKVTAFTPSPGKHI